MTICLGVLPHNGCDGTFNLKKLLNLGAISIQQLGGDVNVRDIADIDYFKNKLYAAMKIPKQFLGDTD